MGGSNSKGSRAERELVNWLADHDWAALRAPTSGGGTDRDLPDIIAGKGGRSVAVELKSTGDRAAYYDSEEVEQLLRFAADFGAEAYLAARFEEEYGDPSYGEDWPGVYLAAPNHLPNTDTGRLVFSKERALISATPLPEL